MRRRCPDECTLQTFTSARQGRAHADRRAVVVRAAACPLLERECRTAPRYYRLPQRPGCALRSSVQRHLWHVPHRR